LPIPRKIETWLRPASPELAELADHHDIRQAVRVQHDGRGVRPVGVGQAHPHMVEVGERQVEPPIPVQVRGGERLDGSPGADHRRREPRGADPPGLGVLGNGVRAPGEDQESVRSELIGNG
jgi:hypothetical protein